MNDLLLPFEILRDHGLSAFTFDFGRYIIAASLFAAIVWMMRRTQLASRKIQAREATRADIQRELVASFQTCLVYVLITVLVIWGRKTDVLQPFDRDMGWLPGIGLLIAIVIAHDAYFYWAHRIMHHPRLFKTFHRFHHKTVTPTPFTAYAFAVPEAFVMAIFFPIWQFFVPTPPWVMFTFLNLQIIRNVMGHAGVELHPRWWLKTPLTAWISTTTHHDMHHSGSFNHNYGFYFRFWDKMMGTEHPKYTETFERVVSPAQRAKGSVAVPSTSL